MDKIKNKMKKILKDKLYNNSLFLIINAGIMSFLGFIFWIIAARSFSAAEIGLAVTLISLINILSNFSNLGFNISLIRYLPQSNIKSKIIYSTINLTILFSILFSAIIFILVYFFYPEMNYIKDSPLIYFFLIIIFTSIVTQFNLIESIFIALRKSWKVLFKNLIWSILKILGLFLFFGLNIWGIYISWFGTLIIALIIALFLINVKYKFFIDLKIIKRLFKYSFLNYISNTALIISFIGLPIFVTYMLGTDQTAYFYMSWMIANLLFFVPQSIGKIFISEGSHSKKNSSIIKALKFNYIIIGIGIILGILLSRIILSFFGELYLENSFKPLIILLISSLFYSYNSLMISQFNLEHKLKKVILVNSGICILTFFFSFLLINLGLIGISLGWLIANIILNLGLLGGKKWN
ncbi:oligosaccharide flippase family protein [Candidatus Woesearchaeota archaeon]|nr:oligosaccharide flippase family protein [Candidatus Woesearchaeota archaeon]MBT7296259.1 oligosaccharide flippase family protein [Candidatus Woesearchaeota archaeon]